MHDFRYPLLETWLVPALYLSRERTAGHEYQRWRLLCSPVVDDERRRALDWSTLVAKGVLIPRPERPLEVHDDLREIAHAEAGDRVLLGSRQRWRELHGASFQNA